MSAEPHPALETIHDIHSRARLRFGSDVTEELDPTFSPLYRRAIFLVGAPRSGTTWLQQLLATHPDIATSGESHVFCEGVAAFLHNYGDGDPTMKLSTWIDQAALLRLMRSLVDDIFESMRIGLRPSATRILDKTPNHVRYAESLARVYPDAAFIHLIRDGRDVAESAHGLWGMDPSWRTPRRVAETWRRAVLDNRQHLSGRWYREVRYEDLTRDTPGHFTSILDALGLDHSPSYLDAAVQFARSPVNIRPSGGRVGPQKWRSMEADVERDIVGVAGDLLVELGYLTEAERRAIRARRSPRTVALGAVRRAGFLVERSGQRLDGARRARRLARREVTYRAATKVADLATAGTGEPDQLLGPAVVLEEQDGATCAGPGAVAGRLAAITVGGRVLRVDADERSAAIYIVDSGGVPRMLRCSVVGGRVDRISLADAR